MARCRGFPVFSTEVHLQTHLEERPYRMAQNRCSVSSGTVSGKVNGSGEQIQNVLYQPGWPQVAIHELALSFAWLVVLRIKRHPGMEQVRCAFTLASLSSQLSASSPVDNGFARCSRSVPAPVPTGTFTVILNRTPDIADIEFLLREINASRNR